MREAEGEYGSRPMAPVDAFWYWLGLRIPNDQFLLYAFDGTISDVDEAIDEVRGRARSHPDFGMRIAERTRFAYPVWARREVSDDQFVVHRVDGLSWAECLDALVDLTAHSQLDSSSAAWRLHVFPVVDGVPGAYVSSTVAVVQMSHALGDGRRSSDLAAYLFGRPGGVVPVTPRPARGLVGRRIEVMRARRQLDHDTAAGRVPAEPVPVPVVSTNSAPIGRRVLRTVIRKRAELPDSSVTVSVLSAIADGLGGILRGRGEDVSMLSAQVLMGHRDERFAHNWFDSAAVRLHPDITEEDHRRQRIQLELDEWRLRHDHPYFAVKRSAFDAMPAVVRRWGTAHANFDVQLKTVPANTVVSSVHRGPADISFGGRPVILTSGYPAIFPMMGMTHGVHRIGDTVAISVHTAESVIGDVDDYVDRLLAALANRG